jgi:hypothetical protein
MEKRTSVPSGLPLAYVLTLGCLCQCARLHIGRRRSIFRLVGASLVNALSGTNDTVRIDSTAYRVAKAFCEGDGLEWCAGKPPRMLEGSDGQSRTLSCDYILRLEG